MVHRCRPVVGAGLTAAFTQCIRAAAMPASVAPDICPSRSIFRRNNASIGHGKGYLGYPHDSPARHAQLLWKTAATTPKGADRFLYKTMQDIDRAGQKPRYPHMFQNPAHSNCGESPRCRRAANTVQLRSTSGDPPRQYRAGVIRKIVRYADAKRTHKENAGGFRPRHFRYNRNPLLLCAGTQPDTSSAAAGVPQRDQSA